MSRWNHAICDECYVLESQQNDEMPEQPVRVSSALVTPESCCFCGKTTSSGTYVRKNPETTLCKGVHRADVG